MSVGIVSLQGNASPQIAPLLVLMRHGQAEPYRADDASRALVPTGVAEVQRSAEYLRQHGIPPHLLVASPYLRARQSAATIAEALQLPAALQIEPLLQPDQDPDRAASLLAALVDDAAGQLPGSVLLVATHMPLIAGLLRSFTGIEHGFGTGSLVVLSRLVAPGQPVAWRLKHRFDPGEAR